MSVEQSWKRYNQLKKEKEIINDMKCLSFDLKEQCLKWYDHEITALMLGGLGDRVNEG